MFTSLLRIARDRVSVRCALLTLATSLAPALVFAQTGTVTGRVTSSATSAPIANAQVTLCAESGSGSSCFSDLTDAAGVYERAVPAGTYYAYTSNSGHINEVFANVQCPLSACSAPFAFSVGTPIVVGPGATVSGRDFALDPGGSIAGTIVDAATGAPLQGITVNVYARLSATSSASFVASAQSDASGNYAVRGLPSGTYFAFTSNFVGYTNEIFDNVLCPGICSAALTVESGTAIRVVTGQTTGNTNFALARGGTITGTITNAATSTPAANVSVTVYTRVGDTLAAAGFGFANASGVYTVTGLPAGTYYVATSGSAGGLLNEIYNNVICSGFCVPTFANPGTPVQVNWGTTTPGIDFQLEPGGSIEGTITDASTGTPLQGVTVTVYRQVGTSVLSVASGFTNASGNYSVLGLPTGTYFVLAASNTHLDEVYDNVACAPACTPATILSGTPVAATAGAVTPNINFALNQGGSISGTVTNAATSAPLSGVPVLVYTVVGGTAVQAGTAFTDSSGNWTVAGLAPGTYFAFTDVFGATQRWQNEIYNDIPCPTVCSVTTATSSGTPITVTTGTTTGGINFGLNASTSPPPAPVNLAVLVSGYVARLSWSPGIGGGLATSYILEAGLLPGQTLVTLATTATSLEVPGVPPGRYYVRVRAVNAFGSSAPSAEVEVIVNSDGSGVLHPPMNLTARMNGSRLTVTWADPPTGGVPDGYVLEVGTVAGVANLVSFPVGARNFTFEGVPNGVYFIRVRARVGGQLSAPSNDAMIVVGNVPSPPEAPRSLTHTVSGSTLTLNWALPLFGTPTGYIIEAGTASGLANIAAIPTGSTALSATFTGVPPGTYYVRVRAVNAQGASVVSNERVIVVS